MIEEMDESHGQGIRQESWDAAIRRFRSLAVIEEAQEFLRDFRQLSWVSKNDRETASI